MGKKIRGGIFIIYEGGDKSGKTTQLKRTADYLQEKGLDVIITKEPGGGDPLIREKLLDPNIHRTPEEERDLFCEDRRLHAENVIIPALAKGQIVLCDRFEPSTVAYQGGGGGLQIEFIREKSKEARNGVWPDLILLYDLAPEEAFKRFKEGEKKTSFEKKGMDYHHRVRETFLAQAREAKNGWRIIDAAPSEEEVWEQTKKHIDSFFFREFDIMLDA